MFALDDATTEKLKKISSDLNEQSSALTEGFKEVEEMLASLKLGVTAWATEPIKDRDKSYEFGFCKIKNRWHLVCKEIVPEVYRNSNSYGLLKTITYMPRHIRIEAASRLEDLVQQIIAKTEEFSSDIKGALENIKGVSEIIST